MWKTICLILFGTAVSDDSYASYKPLVACNEKYIPENCGYPNITLENIVTVEDIERCGPAMLPNDVRNFFWGGAGRKYTFYDNFDRLSRMFISPRILHDVSKNDLRTTLLGSQVQVPIGISPVSTHDLAHPDGEIGTVKAIASLGAVMTLSCASQTSIEDVAEAAFSVDQNAVLWMQTYIFRNRNETLQIIRRAEKAGFKAIVVTVDSPITAIISCKGRGILEELKLPNLFDETFDPSKLDPSLTFDDLRRVTKATKLPVVAKGILTGTDAIKAARAGVSAILVSNHGGRQLESTRATIDVLPEVVSAVRKRFPKVEVYMDSGVRNGWDTFKVLSLGAKAAFVGRPVIWGLAIGGEDGVRKMMTILRSEFNESMIVAGYSNPKEINQGSRERPIIPLPPLPSIRF